MGGGLRLINEPADPSGEKVFPYYRRLFDAIRKIDPHHIIFLEGNRYATDFDMFTEIWDNVVYTNHDYAGPGVYSTVAIIPACHAASTMTMT